MPAHKKSLPAYFMKKIIFNKTLAKKALCDILKMELIFKQIAEE